jgi:hypothetical protein
MLGLDNALHPKSRLRPTCLLIVLAVGVCGGWRGAAGADESVEQVFFAEEMPVSAPPRVVPVVAMEPAPIPPAEPKAELAAIGTDYLVLLGMMVTTMVIILGSRRQPPNRS